MKITILLIFLTAGQRQNQLYPRYVIEGDQFIYQNHERAEPIYIKL